MKSILKKLVLGIALLLAVSYAAWHWQLSRQVRSTENAYLNADRVQIGSLVSGIVVAVHVRDGQFVEAGAPLFDIDPAPFLVAQSLAEARLAEAEQARQESLSDVDADQASLAQADADLANLTSSARRVHQLVRQNFLSTQSEEDADAKVKMAQAIVDEARARLDRAHAHVASVDGATPAVLAARASLEQARLDLSHAHISARQAGWIAHHTLVPGSLINAQTPLFALIVQGSFWVDANFKETELPGIHPGQRADVDVEMLPGQHFHGVVESISSGTGAAFSLLPAQNATGNWVKVVQRVPVRIRLQDNAALQPLCVGASAEVTVQLQKD